MKNKILLCNVLFAVTTLTIFSCATTGGNAAAKGGWKTNTAPKSEYHTYTDKKTLVMYPELGKKSPKLSFAVNLLDTNNSSVKVLLNKTLYDGIDSKQYAAARFNDISKKYIDIKPEVYNQEEVGASFNWDFNETGEGAIYNNIIVINRIRYMFEGGAHGLQEKEYFVLNTETKNRVRFNDIIPANAIPQLKKYAETELRKKYAAINNMAVKPGLQLTALGFFEDAVDIPVENYFVTPEGLGFAWNPYKIAPYSFGVVEVILPYNNISDFLNAQGKALFASVRQK